jgi:hypothetical protein
MQMSFLWNKLSFFKYIEIFCIVSVLLLSAHFFLERIDHRTIPQGDEGSWMAVAAELSRGHGFTTRWLEHPFLLPYQIPRPDDYRYPALTVIIATVFKVSGISYDNALYTVTAIFLLFLLSAYIAIRFVYGRLTATISIALMSISLLQLFYNPNIYCEGLFGIVLSMFIFFTSLYKPSQLKWWIAAGIFTGLLYLVRPNGILFIAGIALYFIISRKSQKINIRFPIAAIVTALIITLPWLIRTYYHFGNPFHIAGSAGLLRANFQEPLTYSFSDFVRIHGIWYFFDSIKYGVVKFFEILDFQEHQLEIIPLLSCIAGILLRIPFFSPVVLISFIITFFACAYSSHESWAGVRYFSSFIPFIYAYGIHSLLVLTRKYLPKKVLSLTVIKVFVPAILIIVCALPVYYPHRYYEKTFSKPFTKLSYDAYYTELARMTEHNKYYFANSLAQLNFATSLNCIGMNIFLDENEILRAQDHFKPSLMVLTKDEWESARIKKLINALEKNGYELKVHSEINFAKYILIRKSSDQQN